MAKHKKKSKADERLDSIRAYEQERMNAKRVRWVINEDVKEGIFHFHREWDGRVDESYRAYNRQEAAVVAAAIIQGLEPPRDLRCRDIPVH